jgi:Tol biopolymer transport system component
MSDTNPSLIGRPLGAYQIVSLLGVGGMGEVYRARDTRLGRDVAIKVLPTAVADDPQRLSRFEREARVLAALNHPNIAAIYGFEESDGRRALVLEIVEGPTLAEQLAHGPLELTTALTIARQIAEALEAAHATGVIHRDLKPANIKVTAAGVVKVLDFGLAKMWAQESSQDISQDPTMTATGTRDGLVLGTAAYMSPDQARGKPVDQRTDVWAFGCVLFEMLAGTRAFEGDTISDTIARILEREPDWQQLPRSTPARVRDLLRRCLQKDPQKRSVTFADARQHIDACLASPFKVPRAMLEALRWNVSRPAVRWTLLGVGAVAAAAIVYVVRDQPAPVPQLANPIQVTNAIGVEDYPTWSPDGRTLAYESNETENWDIWLAQVGGGAAVNRTADYSGSDRYPSWSPDGRHIAFWSDRDGGGYYVMPALGGTPRLIVGVPGATDWYNSPPTWSPDSAQLACVVYKTADNRYEVVAQIVSMVTREVREVSLPGKAESRLDLNWSPDGRYLAYVDGGTQLAELTQLMVLRLADGEAVFITDGTTNVRSPRWSRDGRHLFFVSNQVGVTDWWRQRLTGDGEAIGEPERVTTALEVPNGSFSSDGTRLAYSKGRWVSNVWRVPILKDRPATWADAEQITFEQAFIEFFDVSPDGRELAFSSDRAGNQDVWKMPVGGKQAVQLTANPVPDWNPAWSPDGRQLAFYSHRSGNRDIWVMPSAGGSATQLTRTSELEAGGAWSPDGRRIVFRSERTGDSEIWVMNQDGSDPRQLTHDPAGDYGATWSPDGEWVVFHSNRGEKSRIWRVAAAGGTPELLSERSGVSPRWSRDGEEIFFIAEQERAGNFWALSLKDRTERAITNLVGKRGLIGMQYPATDGTYIYFPWRDDLGDIWVMDVQQP